MVIALFSAAFAGVSRNSSAAKKPVRASNNRRPSRNIRLKVMVPNRIDVSRTACQESPLTQPIKPISQPMSGGLL